MDLWGLNTKPVNPGPLESGQKFLCTHFMLFRVRTRSHQDLAAGTLGSRARGQFQSPRAERLTLVALPTATRDMTRCLARSVQCECQHEQESAPQSSETFSSLLYSLVFTSLMSKAVSSCACRCLFFLVAKYLLTLENTKMSPT